MRHGSLFSGVGGFDLAAEWMGWENIFHCEWNPFGQHVLKYYWPNAISYHDITKTDFTIHRGGIDILTGGFPCQPYSSAGKRLSKEDERHLWPHMLRAVREIQPGYVVGENVRGLTNWNGGVVFDEVQADLEAEGYEVLPFLLPACAVGAPHRRDRIWFVAYANGSGWRRNGWPQEYYVPQNYPKDRTNFFSETERLGKQRIIANTDSLCMERISERISDGSKRRQEEGRQHSQSPRNDWSEWPTQSPVCSRDDGLSSRLAGITFSKHRNESIKAYGNAIVPQVAYQIFQTIQVTTPSPQ